MLYREWVIDVHKWPTGRKPGRVLVVGDVHGQMAMLMRLLRMSEYVPSADRLIALGDLVDRGPASAEAVRWFAAGPLRTSLLGNHDALMIDAEHLSGPQRVWLQNGGRWSEQQKPFELDLLRRLVSGFPLAVTLHLADGRRIGLVHAEVRPGATWADVQRVRYDVGDAVDDRCRSVLSNLLWGRQRHRVYRALAESDLESIGDVDRERILSALAPVRGVDMVICGHTIMRDRLPVRFGSHLYIDTGAYEEPDGRLTLFDPVAEVYWQVGRSQSQQWGPLPLPTPVEDGLPAYVYRRGRTR